MSALLGYMKRKVKPMCSSQRPRRTSSKKVVTFGPDEVHRFDVAPYDVEVPSLPLAPCAPRAPRAPAADLLEVFEAWDSEGKTYGQEESTESVEEGAPLPELPFCPEHEDSAC